MVHPQEDNFILRCGKLFHQYGVDMYAKIESERLNYLRFNQAQEEYIHLQDAIVNDGDVNNIGRLTNNNITSGLYWESTSHASTYTRCNVVRSQIRPP